jgi:hypothetical protein
MVRAVDRERVLVVYPVVFPKEGQVKRNACFLRCPPRSKKCYISSVVGPKYCKLI